MLNIKNLLIASLFMLMCSAFAQTKTTRKFIPIETQIKIALQAAPQNFRDSATVYGFNEKNEFVTLRAGSNGMICLAPDYREAALYAYCYPESLEPFMARGRELIAQGKRKERDKIREEEFNAGTLSIPQQATTLYGYYGSVETLNYETGEIADAQRRYVIYVPFAKAVDLGLPSKGNNLGMPWLMNEGTYKAHIMITPPHKH